MQQIIFDLDHTLFNTSLFKENIFNILSKNGANDEDVKKSYDEHLRESSGVYDFTMHAKMLKNVSENFKLTEALKDFEDFKQSDFKEYVSEDVFSSLQALKGRELKLTLLTNGDKEIQMTKIRQSGLDGFFDDILISDGDKSSIMESIDLNDDDFFINDNWKETARIMIKFPQLKYVLIKRNDLEKFHKLSDITIPMIDSVSELLPLLEK